MTYGAATDLSAPSYTPSGLIEQLRNSDEKYFVRLIATWLQRAHSIDKPAQATNNLLINSLVAAASAYKARSTGSEIPSWTIGHEYDHFWFPGPEWNHAWSLVHSPADFRVRNLFIDEESLKSV
jgi:hypothetical protein